jgi:hypothetical protein
LVLAMIDAYNTGELGSVIAAPMESIARYGTKVPQVAEIS